MVYKMVKLKCRVLLPNLKQKKAKMDTELEREEASTSAAASKCDVVDGSLSEASMKEVNGPVPKEVDGEIEIDKYKEEGEAIKSSLSQKDYAGAKNSFEVTKEEKEEGASIVSANCDAVDENPSEEEKKLVIDAVDESHSEVEKMPVVDAVEESSSEEDTKPVFDAVDESHLEEEKKLVGDAVDKRPSEEENKPVCDATGATTDVNVTEIQSGSTNSSSSKDEHVMHQRMVQDEVSTPKGPKGKLPSTPDIPSNKNWIKPETGEDAEAGNFKFRVDPNPIRLLKSKCRVLIPNLKQKKAKMNTELGREEASTLTAAATCDDAVDGGLSEASMTEVSGPVSEEVGSEIIKDNEEGVAIKSSLSPTDYADAENSFKVTKEEKEEDASIVSAKCDPDDESPSAEEKTLVIDAVEESHSEEEKKPVIDAVDKNPSEEEAKLVIDVVDENPSEEEAKLVIDAVDESHSEEEEKLEIDAVDENPSEEEEKLVIDAVDENPSEEEEKLVIDVVDENPSEDEEKLVIDAVDESHSEEKLRIDVVDESHSEEEEKLEIAVVDESHSEEKLVIDTVDESHSEEQKKPVIDAVDKRPSEEKNKPVCDIAGATTVVNVTEIQSSSTSSSPCKDEHVIHHKIVQDEDEVSTPKGPKGKLPNTPDFPSNKNCIKPETLYEEINYKNGILRGEDDEAGNFKFRVDPNPIRLLKSKCRVLIPNLKQKKAKMNTELGREEASTLTAATCDDAVDGGLSEASMKEVSGPVPEEVGGEINKDNEEGEAIKSSLSPKDNDDAENSFEVTKEEEEEDASIVSAKCDPVDESPSAEEKTLVIDAVDESHSEEEKKPVIDAVDESPSEEEKKPVCDVAGATDVNVTEIQSSSTSSSPSKDEYDIHHKIEQDEVSTPKGPKGKLPDTPDFPSNQNWIKPETLYEELNYKSRVLRGEDDEASNFKFPVDPNRLLKEATWHIPELMVLKRKLNEVKGLLDYYPLDEWHQHTKKLNISNLIVIYVQRYYNPEFSSTAWGKMFEILCSYDVVPRFLIDELKGLTKDQKRSATGKQIPFDSVHLCEAPGAFISALNHFLKISYSNIDWNWLATTLNPYYEGNDIGNMINDDRLILKSMNGWTFLEDSTGNIMSTKNIRKLCVEQTEKLVKPRVLKGQKSDRVLLVTADGSIDCQSNPAEQEAIVAHLQFSEIIAALKLLQPGGSFVLKIFTFLEAATISHLYLLSCAFKEVNLFKPSTSKEGNSEVYVVCLGFLADSSINSVIENQLFPTVETYGDLLKEGKTLVPLDLIPRVFIERIMEAADFFCNYQMKIIRRNASCFPPRENVYEAMVPFREEAAEQWIKWSRIRKLQNKDRLFTSEHDSKIRASCHLDAKDEHGTFHDKLTRLKGDDVQKLSYIKHDLLTYVHWNGFENHVLRVCPIKDVPIVFEAAYDNIRSSRFCYGRILSDKEKVKEIAKNYMSELEKIVGIKESVCTACNGKQIAFFMQKSLGLDVVIEKKQLKVLCFKRSAWELLTKTDFQRQQEDLTKVVATMKDLDKQQSMFLCRFPMLTRLQTGLILSMTGLFEKASIYGNLEGMIVGIMLYKFKGLDHPQYKKLLLSIDGVLEVLAKEGSMPVLEIAPMKTLINYMPSEFLLRYNVLLMGQDVNRTILVTELAINSSA